MPEFVAEDRDVDEHLASQPPDPPGLDRVLASDTVPTWADPRGLRARVGPSCRERKAYGTGTWIEGCARSPVAIVDDVVTSGGSVIKAIERALEEGLEIAHVAVLVDREEAGMEAVRRILPSVPVTAIFEKAELDALRAQEHGDD